MIWEETGKEKITWYSSRRYCPAMHCSCRYQSYEVNAQCRLAKLQKDVISVAEYCRLLFLHSV